MPDAPELRPGMVVRWKGVSPQCSRPGHHHAMARYIIGRVFPFPGAYLLPNGKMPPADHSVVIDVNVPHLYALARPDEVEPVDEWGIDTAPATFVGLPESLPVGVSA